MADIKIYPYGNARTNKAADGSVSFVCQHGADQCTGNIILACALNMTGFTLTGLKYFACIENEANANHNFEKAAVNCGTKHGVDSKSVMDCANSDKGKIIEAAVGDVTAGLNPPHKYVPWITVNNQHNANQEDAVRSDLVKFVCNTYQGTKIAACAGKQQ